MRRSRGIAAFTLLELMLVVVIISLLAAIVAPQIVGRSREAKIGTAKGQIANFESALELYKLDNDNYPSTEQGLIALRQQPSGDPPANNWKEPYLKKDIPKDPWGNDYVYTCPGKLDPNGYDIVSPGPDGKMDTEDDITNQTDTTSTTK